jgi:hypothetical protein
MHCLNRDSLSRHDCCSLFKEIWIITGFRLNTSVPLHIKGSTVHESYCNRMLSSVPFFTESKRVASTFPVSFKRLLLLRLNSFANINVSDSDKGMFDNWIASQNFSKGTALRFVPDMLEISW